MKIIPSIASADPLALGAEIDRLGKISCLHLDIEDGNFCPSMTFGMDTIRAIALHTKAELDAHLMVTNPISYVDRLCEYGISSIAAHIEALAYPAMFLGKVRSKGKKAGLALNLKTDASSLEAFSGQLDYVLFLTNEPDYNGLSFNEYSLKKIADCRRFLPENIELWADGGVTQDLLPSLRDCGVDTAIMGRAIFSASSPEEKYSQIVNSLSTGRQK
jgi:ribulose-phosphate 3-epimerase